MSDISTKSLVRPFSEVVSSTTPEETNTAAVLTVAQLNLRIKQVLEGQIGQVWVQGEISNFKAHTSGHFYFSLKDSKAQISAVMFRGSNSRLRFKPHDGLEVIVRGRVTVYEPRGNYQIMCEAMEPVGAGALQKAFEQLREKLKAEGLFAPERKRSLPELPRGVAVVTSPTGAAIRDILNVLSRRAKSVPVTVVPTIVQGEGAAPKIIEALRMATRLPGVDVIILGRGGGSIEDLWAFNDESLAREIAACPVPIISAVGHEIDFTISDFVADLRAPTPSAAAELVARSSAELQGKVVQLRRLLMVSMETRARHLREKFNGARRRLVDPRQRLRDFALRNDDLVSRLEFAWRRSIEGRRHRLDMTVQKMGRPTDRIERSRSRVDLAQVVLQRAVSRHLERSKSRWERLVGVLESLSPLRVVDRGYAIVLKGDQVIKSKKQVAPRDELKVRLSDGEISVTVQG